MNFMKSAEFTAERAWGALDIGLIEGASVRLHWTDRPYVWHVNDGAEVFAVMDGAVDMRYRENGEEKSRRMEAGDICYAAPGDEHVAHPVGAARVLVVEK